MQNKLFESYIKSASRYLTEDDDELEDVVDVDDTETVEDTDVDTETGADEEVLELDLANPVCPSCGASLVITDEEPIDTEDEDLGLEDDEADAIQLLQGLGYIVYKPTEPAEEDETIDDDAAIDDETLDDDEDDFTEDEDF